MHHILKWHAWSSIRKAQLTGAVAGLLVTTGSWIISRGVAYNDDVGYLVFALNLLLLAPTAIVFQLLGRRLVLQPEANPWVLGFIVVVINMIASALLAALAAWVWGHLKAGSKDGKP